VPIPIKISGCASAVTSLSDDHNLRKTTHTSFEFQTRNYNTCFGHICNHPHGQEDILSIENTMVRHKCHFDHAMRTKTQFSIDSNVIMMRNNGFLQDNHVTFFHKIQRVKNKLLFPLFKRQYLENY